MSNTFQRLKGVSFLVGGAAFMLGSYFVFGHVTFSFVVAQFAVGLLWVGYGSFTLLR